MRDTVIKTTNIILAILAIVTVAALAAALVSIPIGIVLNVIFDWPLEDVMRPTFIVIFITSLVGLVVLPPSEEK